MSNSTEVYCLNAYDNGGNFLCTLRCGQPSEIGQDYQYLIPNIGNREVDYICYTDKCGCACCLSNENEIIIHSTQGEIKTLTGTPSRNCIYVKWSEIFGGNWCRTMVRYKNNGYPTSITDGTLGGIETTQNQYSSSGLCVQVPNYSTTYYFRTFALDGNDNIIMDRCDALTSGSNFVTTCWGYTGGVQTYSLGAGTYKFEVRGAQGGSSGCVGGYGGYASACITLQDLTTIYIQVGGAGSLGTNVNGGYNGGGKACSTQGRNMTSGGGGTDIRIGVNDLYHRVIVAGGGGGAAETNYGGGNGYAGAGGGLNGLNNCGSSSARYGYGGSQTAGGNARTETSWDNSYINTCLKGSFGCGGGACGISTYYIDGGGGGWYGGGAGGPDGGAGGGSGYIWSSTSRSCHPNQSCMSGVPYMTGGILCAGNTSFPTPAGGTETGHTGNGCVKISLI